MTPATLITALERTCTLLDSSEEALWSTLSPREVAANLRGAIAQLHRGEVPDLLMIRVEFAPTGSLQEIAMANHWHDDYMELAGIVDEYMRQAGAGRS